MPNPLSFKLKFLLTVVLMTLLTSVYAQFPVTKMDTAHLPGQLKYSGHIIHSLKWTDSLGVNYFLTTETGESVTIDKDGNEFTRAELFAYHYILKGDSLHLLWKIYDFNKDCEFDVSVKYIDKACKITDLDKNGIAEVWVMYETQCTSDVSPSPTKIIMYEGTKKYAVRGESKVKISEKDYIGGQYTLDENFKNGNSLFRQFAIALWKQHIIKNQ